MDCGPSPPRALVPAILGEVPLEVLRGHPEPVQEPRVGGELLQPGAADLPEEPHRVATGRLPQLGVDLDEDVLGRRVPRPAQIAGELPQRAEGLGQDRTDREASNRTHERQRTWDHLNDPITRRRLARCTPADLPGNLLGGSRTGRVMGARPVRHIGPLRPGSPDAAAEPPCPGRYRSRWRRPRDGRRLGRGGRGPAPFVHGVASGDPLPRQVILWTRVTPSAGGSRLRASAHRSHVEWEVASDAAFRRVVAKGSDHGSGRARPHGARRRRRPAARDEVLVPVPRAGRHLTHRPDPHRPRARRGPRGPVRRRVLRQLRLGLLRAVPVPREAQPTSTPCCTSATTSTSTRLEG